jgi:outer membrane protein assembly factor BamB
MDLRSMTPLWRFEAGDDTDATLALELEGEVPRLYTGCEVDKTGPRGRTWLRRLNGLTGAAEWERSYLCQGSLVPKKDDAGVFATPAPGCGEVGHLVLDKRTGEEAWRVELPKYSWSSPTLLSTPSGRVYLLLGGIGGVLRLFEATTGREVTSLKLVGDIESSPAVFEGRIVLGTRGNRIYGIDIR